MNVSRQLCRSLGPLGLAALLMTAGTGCASPPSWQALPGGLEVRRLPAEAGQPALTLVRVPEGVSIRVRVRRSEEGLLASELASEERVLAAVNANFFGEDRRPLGWVVADAAESSGLGRSGWGVLSVDASGSVRIRRPASVPDGERASQAIQAGPLLVEGGRANPGLKAQSARRVFVGLDRKGRLVLGSTGIARADAPALAARLARPEAVGGAALVEVLNLDGGSSAQLYVRAGAGDSDSVEPGLVRVPVLLTLEAND